MSEYKRQQITIERGELKPIEQKESYLLIMQVMHGDADSYEDFIISFNANDEEEMRDLPRIIDMCDWYLQLPWNSARDYKPSDCPAYESMSSAWSSFKWDWFDDFPTDATTGHNVLTQLMKYELLYFDAAGLCYNTVITKVPCPADENTDVNREASPPAN